MITASETPLLQRHVQEVRDLWQGRVLDAARGRMMLAVTSMLAHSFDEAMPVLLNVVQPMCWDAGRQSLRTPFLCSIAKVNKAGQIVADAICFDGALPTRGMVIFASTKDFERELRRLSDRLKLNDQDRVEFFKVATRWVASDQRLDPTMNPADPDAKRLVN